MAGRRDRARRKKTGAWEELQELQELQEFRSCRMEEPVAGGGWFELGASAQR
jgi:hypothetical protein